MNTDKPQTTKPFLVEPGWIKVASIKGLHDNFRVLFYKNGVVRFEHECKSGGGDDIITAPLLSNEHKVVWDAQDDWNRPTVTITPSLICEGCGLHGFVQKGRWIPA